MGEENSQAIGREWHETTGGVGKNIFTLILSQPPKIKKDKIK